MRRSNRAPRLSPLGFEARGSFECLQASVRWNLHGRNTAHGPEQLRICCAVPSNPSGQGRLGSADLSLRHTLQRLSGAELQRDGEIARRWTDRTGFPPVICFATEGKARLAEAGASQPDMALSVDVNWVKRWSRTGRSGGLLD
jgi:hypothetical protein